MKVSLVLLIFVWQLYLLSMSIKVKGPIRLKTTLKRDFWERISAKVVKIIRIVDHFFAQKKHVKIGIQELFYVRYDISKSLTIKVKDFRL